MTDKTCFMIYPFSQPYKKRVKDIYKPAIELAGLTLDSADDAAAEIITEYIENGICKSHICFADITENNLNVWYEVGFAYACGKPVVMVCNKAIRSAKELPFDIRVKSVIFYEDVVDSSQSDCDGFKQKITERAMARVKKSNSGNTASLVTAQQSENFDKLFTTLDGNVLREIFLYRLRFKYPMYGGHIISHFPDESDEDVLISIGRLESAGYIEGITDDSGESEIGYSSTEKGSRWCYEHIVSF